MRCLILLAILLLSGVLMAVTEDSVTVATDDEPDTVQSAPPAQPDVVTPEPSPVVPPKKGMNPVLTVLLVMVAVVALGLGVRYLINRNR